MDIASLVATEKLPTAMNTAAPSSTDMDPVQKKKILCMLLGISEEELEYLKRCKGILQELSRRCDNVENQCTTVAKKCTEIEQQTELVCCAYNVLYSEPTIDNFSDNSKIDLDQVVQNVAGFQNAFPVAPGQKILLTHKDRPGFVPAKWAADFALENNGNNYLDIRMQFIIAGNTTDLDHTIGSTYGGNELLNKDGTQIHLPFPTYKDKIISIGSLEKLYIVIEHVGAANNLASTYVRVHHDVRKWYRYCKDEVCG